MSDVDLIDLREWSEFICVSQQYAAKMCRDGRIDGAVLVDGFKWMVPKDAVKPKRRPNPNVLEAARRRLERKQGLAQGPVMTQSHELKRQMEIDGWIDKGCEIDDAGIVRLNGERVGQVAPWGVFERKWYAASLASM